MPWAPARPCTAPMCRNLVTGKYSKCELHRRQEQRVYDAGRRNDPYRKLMSDPRWRAFRQRYLLEHPYCARCHGMASEIHHPIPRRRGGDPWDPANMVALCRRCHSSEGSRTGERWGK